jgi:hypothetical protein
MSREGVRAMADEEDSTGEIDAEFRRKEYLELKETGKLRERYESIPPPHGLLSALMNDDYDIAEEMLKSAPDLIDRKRDGYSQTALQWMVTENAVSQVRFLLEHGADPSSRDGYGQTPIEVATTSGYGDFSEMKALLREFIEGRHPKR